MLTCVALDCRRTSKVASLGPAFVCKAHLAACDRRARTDHQQARARLDIAQRQNRRAPSLQRDTAVMSAEMIELRTRRVIEKQIEARLGLKPKAEWGCGA